MFTFVTSCCSPHISTSQQKSSTECLIWCQSGCVRILPFHTLRELCLSTVSCNVEVAKSKMADSLETGHSSEERISEKEPLNMQNQSNLSSGLQTGDPSKRFGIPSTGLEQGFYSVTKFVLFQQTSSCVAG